MLILLNSSLRRNRGRLSLVLAALTLGLALVAAHGALAGGHMASPATGYMVHGDATGVPGSTDLSGDALMDMCLAIAETAAMALGALALASALAALLGSIASMRWPVRPLVLTTGHALTSRARPPDLSLLQVFRR